MKHYYIIALLNNNFTADMIITTGGSVLTVHKAEESLEKEKLPDVVDIKVTCITEISPEDCRNYKHEGIKQRTLIR